MIIRATKKVLNLNGIKPTKNDSELNDDLPGEWYVDLISLGHPGKFALHFLHHPTKITIIVPGWSLKNAKSVFKNRVISFLTRHGYKNLINRFDLESEWNLYSTNDRGMLATMNQIKWNSEYHCVNAPSIDMIDYDWIENISLGNLFTTKKTGKKYLMTKNILDEFLRQ